MTPADEARWRELANAATEGPWREAKIDDRGRAPIWTASGDFVSIYANAAFIAAAREAVPALLDEVARLRAEIEQHHAKSICCCGNYVTEHGLGDGHSPVSMYDYALEQAEGALETARRQIGQQIKVISSESERADRNTIRAEAAEKSVAELRAEIEKSRDAALDSSSVAKDMLVESRTFANRALRAEAALREIVPLSDSDQPDGYRQLYEISKIARAVLSEVPE